MSLHQFCQHTVTFTLQYYFWWISITGKSLPTTSTSGWTWKMHHSTVCENRGRRWKWTNCGKCVCPRDPAGTGVDLGHVPTNSNLSPSLFWTISKLSWRVNLTTCRVKVARCVVRFVTKNSKTDCSIEVKHMSSILVPDLLKSTCFSFVNTIRKRQGCSSTLKPSNCIQRSVQLLEAQIS